MRALPPVGCLVTVFLLFAGCRVSERTEPLVTTLFTQMPSAYTGVTFENWLKDSRTFNAFTYRNYYDGGGVGLADFNGDGLLDIYFTANQLPNRLYLNRGDWTFEDVTEAAGVTGRHAWSTGVSVADVNGDGLLDIYVSNSGDVPGDDRANELFINQGATQGGVPTFKELAAGVGLNDKGHSTHAAFFDYDGDGDLDCYLMNNTSRALSDFTIRTIRDTRHAGGGDRLYRNDGERFRDVSEEAGIYGSEIGFGLGVTVGDVDGDGFLDIYVSNDFFERDYLYINQRDGTFREELEERMPYISLSSMGADMADLNNDGFPEIYVTDMLPADDYRLKTMSTFDSWYAYQEGLRQGFYHQFMRNMLHLHNGDGTFSEIGNMAGVAATDWSWSALIADYDLDGYKDIFVANGIYRDLTNQDFIASFEDWEAIKAWVLDNGNDMRKLLEEIPSTPLANYLFANRGDATFTDRAEEWGLATPSFSNGSAYGDLDNDGDLDLVVNNINQEAFLYRNEASAGDNTYLQVRLEGEGHNTLAVGARVTAFTRSERLTLEQNPTRGFQSSVDPVLSFGLGDTQKVDSLVVRWPDGRMSTEVGVMTNQRLTLRQRMATERETVVLAPSPLLFRNITSEVEWGFRHQENAFVDFDREPLLPKMLSREGPRLATGDVNGDGRDDFFIGGAKGQSGALFVQQPGGGFVRSQEAVFAQDAIAEDQGAILFDMDGDGDEDLYVASGGSEYARRAPGLTDRLYINTGGGVMEKVNGRLPPIAASSSCVEAVDMDQDGDMDLFVGGRLEPWQYGLSPRSYLLENDGAGYFSDVTEQVSPLLATVGMVTDAAWTDLHDDGLPDLVVVGEWMPITLMENTGQGFVLRAIEKSAGWWNRVLAEDLDGDGDSDLVLGNLGLNTRLQAPLMMHVHDFDGNGWIEQILSIGGYPMLLKAELTEHLPFLQERYPRHEDYARHPVTDIFTASELQGAQVVHAEMLQTSVGINQGDGTFRLEILPQEAQLAPVYGIAAGDWNDDGVQDLLLAGNFHAARPAIGKMEASYGLFLRGVGESNFLAERARKTGFFVEEEVRDMAIVEDERRGRLLLVARNNGPLQVFSVQ